MKNIEEDEKALEAVRYLLSCGYTAADFMVAEDLLSGRAVEVDWDVIVAPV